MGGSWDFIPCTTGSVLVRFDDESGWGGGLRSAGKPVPGQWIPLIDALLDSEGHLSAILTDGADTGLCWTIVQGALEAPWEPETLCPRCVRDLVDPESSYGFCGACTESRTKDLKAARQERWAPEGWRQRLRRAPASAAEAT